MGEDRWGGGLITRPICHSFSNGLVITIELGTILVCHPSNISENQKVLTALFLLISRFFATGRPR